MQACFKSDVGLKRAQNQDSVFVSTAPVGKIPNLLIVADGMGGHKAGDFASRYTIEKLKECIPDAIYENPMLIINDAIRKVNRMVYEKAQDQEEYRGMGTTLTLACILPERELVVFQVGDSRLYLDRPEAIRQVTRDHSYVEEMVRKGVFTRDSEEYRSKKNIITRAIGGHDFVLADIYEEILPEGTTVLLCSDGLSNMVPDEEMHKILNLDVTLEEKAERLVSLANENGGTDNISVVLAYID